MLESIMNMCYKAKIMTELIFCTRETKTNTYKMTGYGLMIVCV